MTHYLTLVYVHLGTVLAAAVLGAWVLARRKGTGIHKRLGWVYVVLMMLTAAVTLLMPALVGPRLFNHFGFIHLFSVLVLVALPWAIWAARTGQRHGHRQAMVGVFIGGIGVAGLLTLMPGRLMHQWLIAWWWY
jgi:uncharacterized membrane protein